ncbi:hypothetical protein [Winogradskyella sp. SYSU M77433]|uniref:hypothetical protein n=1 Tax=Winogradskyella sp. SYSU M77433 TaxID=3042722 RepID=UPI0024815E8E|nr:hypothetical protein [Winogradskyella sp. SYSU M77433]MDH7912598.1 hypothetical protein [Winogradskyella sp. SYSU M77433]
MNDNSVKEGKTYGIIAYLTLIGVLIAFFTNQDKRNTFISFHIRQGLGLWLLFMCMGYIVGYFNNWNITLSWWIFFSVLLVYGIAGAVSGKMNKIPILGNLFQNVFKSIGQ